MIYLETMPLFVLFESSSLLISSAVLKAILSCLSLIVAGVPDKTKTKEFQVEYVTICKLDFIPHKLPDEAAASLVLLRIQISHQRCLCFFRSLQSFICKGRRQPSK